jgi:hypothetical protein
VTSGHAGNGRVLGKYIRAERSGPSDMAIMVQSINEVSAPDATASSAGTEQEAGPLPGWFFGLLPYTGIALLGILVVALMLICSGDGIACLGKSRENESLADSYELTATR